MNHPPLARVAVIVVAAGDGTRLGEALPKAFVDLNGRPILSHSLDSIFGIREPVQVIVVVPPTQLIVGRQLVATIAGGAVGYTTVVAGGESRQASVAAGLAVLGDEVEVVLVHDAARALAPTALFERVVAEVTRLQHGIVPGLAVSDTIKTVDDAAMVVATVNRSALRAVQTPQGFARKELVAAYAAASTDHTDDAALMAAAGHPVSVMEGDPRAFKITTTWDLRRAQQLLAASVTTVPSIRTGLGVDAHAFADDAELWLAGLFWPNETGLAGHSDGDAVCHALCDALLSAAGLGDIGGVFGVSDPRLENAHGETFLTETLHLVRRAGFLVVNASVQVIANRPRFAARREEAQAVLGDILNAPVSLSATTSDALGFTGRGEGIAAMATVLLHQVETTTAAAGTSA